MTPALLHPALLFGGGFGGLPPKRPTSRLLACVRAGRRSAPLTPSTGGQNGSSGRRILFPCSVVPAETAVPPARRLSRATGTHLLRRFSVIPPLGAVVRGAIAERTTGESDGRDNPTSWAAQTLRSWGNAVLFRMKGARETGTTDRAPARAGGPGSRANRRHER